MVISILHRIFFPGSVNQITHLTFSYKLNHHSTLLFTAVLGVHMYNVKDHSIQMQCWYFVVQNI